MNCFANLFLGPAGFVIISGLAMGADTVAHIGAIEAKARTVAILGSGIDKETESKLFEPFFTTKAKGTGLGLAIVKKIIEQHDGLINIHSVIDKGTEVSFILPISTIESPATED